MEHLYRIEELSTTGWDLIDSDAVKLTKPVAVQKLQKYMDLGHNPDYLRVVIDN